LIGKTYEARTPNTLTKLGALMTEVRSIRRIGVHQAFAPALAVAAGRGPSGCSGGRR